MNHKRFPLIPPALAVVAGGLVLFTGGLHAQTFQYTKGDLVLLFRKTGSPADFAVNLGKVTNYNNLPPGTVVNLPQLSQTQLALAFPELNGVRWSVAGVNRLPVTFVEHPAQTLWIARPRADAAVQSAAWLRRSASLQGNTGAQVDAIGVRAHYAGNDLLGAGPDNTATGVIVPLTGAFQNFNLSAPLGPTGNYANNFQGNVENQTPDDFTASPSKVARSDLYELAPGTTSAGTLNTPGRYLGYFEFKTDGTLTFNTTITVPTPEITGVRRDNGVTTLSFATVNGVTYRLRAAGTAGVTTPVSTWAAGASVVGDGTVKTLQDDSADAVRFFSIEAQP
ncbi:MAG: hypothetical protein HS113_09100 [Verrucomicrobiales bacterium]|nr:hypothetical protein [Verrucomicrobiales bacterium]